MAASAPKRRFNLAGFQEVFVPGSKRSTQMTLGKRAGGGQPATNVQPDELAPTKRLATWSRVHFLSVRP
jgi:hypothetical protein